MGERHCDARQLRRGVAVVRRTLRRPGEAPSGHSFERRLHEQRPRTRLPHRLQRWHDDARDDADRHREAG